MVGGRWRRRSSDGVGEVLGCEMFGVVGGVLNICVFVDFLVLVCIMSYCL